MLLKLTYFGKKMNTVTTHTYDSAPTESDNHIAHLEIKF